MFSQGRENSGVFLYPGGAFFYLDELEPVERTKGPRPTVSHSAGGEKALEKYLKLIADLRNLVQIKCLSFLAFSIARQRSTTKKATKPLNKN